MLQSFIYFDSFFFLWKGAHSTILVVDALAEPQALDGNSFGFVKVVLSLNAGLRITCSFLVVGIFYFIFLAWFLSCCWSTVTSQHPSQHLSYLDELSPYLFLIGDEFLYSFIFAFQYTWQYFILSSTKVIKYLLSPLICINFKIAHITMY